MNKKIIFFTESDWFGKVDRKTFINLRTEYAWMATLNAFHFPIHYLLNQNEIEDIDYAFIIWPKSEKIYGLDQAWRLIDHLKLVNIKIVFIQEGPHDYFEDYSIKNQLTFIYLLNESDLILCHNKSDISYYKGLVENIPIDIIPTLLIEDQIQDIKWEPEDKIIIGGNLCRWYGGYKSLRVCCDAMQQKDVMESGRVKENENRFFNNVLPWTMWLDWMKTLSKYKYAIHMMPTVAAGTFSLNCAFFGIPCVGNKNVDTQRLCFPGLSFDSEDVDSARDKFNLLLNNKDYYKMISKDAKNNYARYFHEDVFKKHMTKILK